MKKTFFKILWPTYISIICGLAIELYFLLSNQSYYVIDKIDFITSNFITIAATILGFTLAVLTFMIGEAKSSIIGYLFDQKKDKLLWQYFAQPVFLGVFGIIISLTSSLFADATNKIPVIITSLLVFSYLSFLLSIVQTAYTLYRILKCIIQDKHKDDTKQDVLAPNPDTFWPQETDKNDSTKT